MKQDIRMLWQKDDTTYVQLGKTTNEDRRKPLWQPLAICKVLLAGHNDMYLKKIIMRKDDLS